MGFTEDQEVAIYNARLVCSSISLVGSLFVIIVYFSLKRLRSLLAFRLILYLSISDCLFSTGMLFGRLDDGSDLCYVQAVVISLFGLSTVLWTVVIAVTMYFVVLTQNRHVEEYETKVIVGCYALSILLAALPFSTDSYGENIEWCWISLNKGRNAAYVWQVLQFYGPLWVAFAVNTYCYYAIRKYLADILASLVGISDTERLEKLKVVNRLQWYPWVMFFCWIMGTVNQIYNYVHPDDPVFVLSIMHFALGSLQGTGNAFVYGFNSSVVAELKQTCCGNREENLLVRQEPEEKKEAPK